MDSERSGSRVAGWFLLLVIVLGVAVRLPRLDYPLWRDEAWVANAVLADTWKEFFYYPVWTPLNPPIFLLVARGVTSLLGASGFTLHLSSMLLSCAGIVCMAILARRLLKPAFAVVATALLSLAPMYVLMGQQLKHYSSDCTAAAMLLLATHLYVSAPGWPRLFALVAVGILAAGLSYPSALLLPAVVIAIVAARGLDSRPRAHALIHGAVFSIILLAVELWLFFFIVNYNREPSLNEHWARAFAKSASPGDLLPFLVERLPKLLIHVPLPGELQTMWPWIGLVLAIAATWISRGSIANRDPSHWFIALTFWLTFCTAAVMNVLRQYPLAGTFADSRLTLYFAPLTALMTAWSLQVVLARVPQKWRSLAPRWLLKTVTATFAIGLLLFSVVLARKVAAKDYWGYEDAQAAIRYIRANIGAEETLYVHAFMSEHAKLYFRLEGWRNPPAVFGDTGYGCCPLGKDLKKTNGNREYLGQDIARLFPSPHQKRLWLVLPRNIYGPNVKPAYDEADQTLWALQERGYKIEKRRAFDNVEVVAMIPGNGAATL